MKAEKCYPEPEFRPMELVITFESAQELQSFKLLSEKSHSVARFMQDSAGMSLEDKIILGDMLGRIDQKLSED